MTQQLGFMSSPREGPQDLVILLQYIMEVGVVAFLSSETGRNFWQAPGFVLSIQQGVSGHLTSVKEGSTGDIFGVP